jgi:hypothetical protein
MQYGPYFLCQQLDEHTIEDWTILPRPGLKTSSAKVPNNRADGAVNPLGLQTWRRRIQSRFSRPGFNHSNVSFMNFVQSASSSDYYNGLC